MKYTKPAATRNSVVLLNFLDSLPDRPFEIVEPGNVQVRWPEGFTRERLKQLASPLLGISASGAAYAMAGALESLAAIAPVEKKKRRMAAWTNDYFTHPQLHPIDWFPERAERGNWRKVGECEVTE